MIGLFDSGHGGLTVLAALTERFSAHRFVYLGDHANVPYGNRDSEEIVALTRAGTELLFAQGCKLVVLACNTATAVACRTLQQDWLPTSQWQGRNLLGIIAPTVEAATQTPWAVSTPQYPQKYNADTIAVFGTRRTIETGVYEEEIRKRCPRMRVVQQACPDLVSSIESGAPAADVDAMVAGYVAQLLEQAPMPHSAILGCTHFPILEPVFRRHLPPATRTLSQPTIVSDSLEDYLGRHPEYLEAAPGGPEANAVPGAGRSVDETGQSQPRCVLLTTGDPEAVEAAAGRLFHERHRFGQHPFCRITPSGLAEAAYLASVST